MKLSVIILNYNVSTFLELCLQSVQKALVNIPSEIIVIDNDSKDDSCAMVRQKFPHITLIENKVNYGFPKGNNIGVEVAQGEYVCILNPDTVVAEDTFEKALNFADKQIDLGALGVKLVDGKGNFLPESKRGVPTPWVAFTKISGLYKIFPKHSGFNQYYAEQIPENGNGAVDILVGAFMLMKTQLYKQVGGFDEDCFMYSDDIDLSYTLLKKGFQNYYYSGTTVIHYKGESTAKDGKYMRRFREAMNFFYKKHFKKSSVFDVFMIIGVYYFSIIKWWQANQLVKTIPEVYIIVSTNEFIKSELQKKLSHPVLIQESTETALNYVSENPSKIVEIIIDNRLISFKKIIETIVNCDSKTTTFKILPEYSMFAVGSNSSNHLGEVIEIKI